MTPEAQAALTVLNQLVEEAWDGWLPERGGVSAVENRLHIRAALARVVQEIADLEAEIEHLAGVARVATQQVRQGTDLLDTAAWPPLPVHRSRP